MPERGWIKQILSGDQAAGRRFVTAHYPRVYALLRHLTGSVETAEDLAQQTFVRAWQALPAFRGQSSLATWLHQIAYREYAHWLRDRREHAPLAEMAETPGRETDPLERLAFRQALDVLPEESRVCFVLCHVQGLSVSEAATVLQIPAGTVKWRLFDARRRLRRLLGDGNERVGNDVPQTECK